VKDIVAYLRLLANPNDSMTLRRVINVPPRKIGATTLDALRVWAERRQQPLMAAVEHAGEIDTVGSPARKALASFAELVAELRDAATEMNVTDLLDFVLQRIRYQSYVDDGTEEGEERWNNVLELRTVAHDYDDLPHGEGLQQFLENVSLLGEADDLDEQRQAVTLMTLHAAKGLEFRVVFLVGMEEGIFPHLRALEDPQQMEEERRLCYVGITRAKERLHLIHAARRQFHGVTHTNPPSRFLDNIPESLWTEGGVRPREYTRREWTPVTRSRDLFEPVSAPQAPSEPLSQAFSPGDRVRHKHFGTGTVLSSAMTADDEEVEVRFDSSKGPVTKKLLASFARLEAID
jgi:DNA helicase-2/ATP-dependent DNA helicase PcrA